jgi:peptide-methionine (R)-S-oxide reductase
MISLRTMLLATLLAACTATGGERATNDSNAEATNARHDGTPTLKGSVKPLKVSHEHWRSLLSKASYHVMFEEGTERAGTSSLNAEKRKGTFICAACYLPLFDSDAKFESGTGWPSFFRPIKGHLATKEDITLGMSRTEYHCARCGGHQGHVFDDGPEPTGLRYCNNGVALRFIPKGEALPALRGDA